ncbi:BEL1-like homeodomain protein 11 [Phragmites australis]|uniref:BEL1-like homeodomain protein 11 n=1 Tax=Phragmites australis TaxID=29695 RepID=UPI002D784D2C|nr:BEL1-like homeodomain protein 11 [Phragmites australis]
MAKHHEKGSPKQDPKEPAPHNAGAGRPWLPAPIQFEQCSHCDEHHQAEGLMGAGPLVLTLGSVAGTDRRLHLCSCGVAPATMSVLRGSRYLRPAQELLSEVVHMADFAAGTTDDEAEKHEQLEAGTLRAMHRAAKNDADGVQAKLLGLLGELESRQERYFGELGRVASSFEPALGEGTAAAYTSLMAQAMARHFGNLRRAILRRLKLHAAAAAARKRSARVREGGEEEEDNDDEAVTDEMVDRVARRTKLAAAARAEQAWRPLRGLPAGSVAVLRAWLFDHFLHPYPDESEKLGLAVSTGLSRSQISNWFINARVRLWKPMIEEMYNDEFSEDSAPHSREDTSGASSS